MRRALSTALGLLGLVLACPAHAQAPAPGAPPPAPYPAPAPAPAPYPGAPAPVPAGAPPGPYYAPAPYPQTSSRRTSLEIGLLYGTMAAYGVGMGVWVSTEIEIKDPALFALAPAVLGVSGPVGVYLLDRKTMPRGAPSAMVAGAVIGAGEGIGIVSLQYVSVSDEKAWGFRELSRATAIGATAGAGGGLALGYLQKPSPRTSLFVSSSVVWGAGIGTMFGYGSSPANRSYREANDSAAWGGLIGYNVALAGTAALSAVHIPSYSSIAWMWGGAGIGFAASLPIYLFYASEGGPPTKRGLVFSGAATTLGVVAAGLFTSGDGGQAASELGPRFARVTSVSPLFVPGAIGLAAQGVLY